MPVNRRWDGREHYRTVFQCRAEFPVWSLSHFEGQGTALDNVLIGNVALFVRLAVQVYFSDVDIFGAVVRGFDREGLSSAYFPFLNLGLPKTKTPSEGFIW